MARDRTGRAREGSEMAEASAFDRVCGEIEQATSLSQLEARGTVRLALKQAGFDARGVAPHELAVVVRRVLPRELELRGVPGSGALCERIAAGLAADAPSARRETPEDVFRRLGSGNR
jgi:hypothetical protein